MKNITLFLLSMATLSTSSFAQPVVTSSITSYPVGTQDSAYGGSGIAPGAGGANVNWDMSALTTIYAAKLTIVTVASTPYASTFPTATFAVKIEGTSTTYNFDHQSTSGIENMAITYGGAGVGTDYSPNLRLSVPIPFNYGDSKSDTFQSTTSGQDTVRLTYDGYGTLKTPFYTYNNVIRIKEDYGTKYAYSWYTMNPFALVMSYGSTANNYVIVTSQPVTTPTEVKNVGAAAQVSVYPNPTSGNTILKTSFADGYNSASVIITDVSGRAVKQMPVIAEETTINTNDLTAGMYFYTVQNGGIIVGNGKLVVNK